jgi:hypothetical protein
MALSAAVSNARSRAQWRAQQLGALDRMLILLGHAAATKLQQPVVAQRVLEAAFAAVDQVKHAIRERQILG